MAARPPQPGPRPGGSSRALADPRPSGRCTRRRRPQRGRAGEAHWQHPAARPGRQAGSSVSSSCAGTTTPTASTGPSLSLTPGPSPGLQMPVFPRCGCKPRPGSRARRGGLGAPARGGLPAPGGRRHRTEGSRPPDAARHDIDRVGDFFGRRVRRSAAVRPDVRWRPSRCPGSAWIAASSLVRGRRGQRRGARSGGSGCRRRRGRGSGRESGSSRTACFMAILKSLTSTPTSRRLINALSSV